MQINDLIDRVAKLDGGEALAKDLRRFVGKRKFGLVYEESKPEYVRLHNKPVVEGDLVNALPPRGTMEDTTGEDDADTIWRVLSIDDNGAAVIGSIETDAAREVLYDDLVAVARFDQAVYCGLSEAGRVARGGDKPYHVVINGENFHALELLMFPYQGEVDCIYIDPPYNTGAKDWKYNNNYVSGEDAYRHSKWLTFMEDRLRLAKKLLNPNSSVLIVTIDEKEYLRLGLLLEQVFPEARIQMVNIIINKNGVARNSEFKRAEEYAFFVMLGDSAPIEMDTATYSPFDDGKNQGPQKVRWEWLLRGGSNSLRTDRPNLFYPIYVDEDALEIRELGEALPPHKNRLEVPGIAGLRQVWPLRVDGTEATWRMQPSSLQKKMDKGLVRIGEYDAASDRYSLLYLADVQEQRMARGEIVVTGKRPDGSLIVEYAGAKKSIPTTVWGGALFSAGEYGSRFITKVFGDKRFTFPKSMYATEMTLAPFLLQKKDALVVDFFAGSGTTAHSMMLLNRLDDGARRTISVTNNEVSFEEAKQLVAQGLRQGDEEWERLGIARYVTFPRIETVITGRKPDGSVLEGDYRFIDEFPMADGFKENAVFYDLTYLEPSVVTANLAFDEIAPLLWMRAGSVGPVITLGDTDPEDATYELTDTYGVLFDYAWSSEFIEECHKRDVDHIFVVTDVDRQYRDMCAEFRGKDVKQLYKSYLRSFEIGLDR